MSKRGAAYFFFAVTGLFIVVFTILTIDSHRRFPGLTNAEEITPVVLAGKDVWHENNCVNCHTLQGEGAYYAPDLTKITVQRGEAYLTQFLKQPSRFYSEQDVGRLMTDPELSDEEIGEVIAFLTWISRIENQNWPPRPILVSGSALPGAYARGVRPPAAASDDPVSLGEELFNQTPPGCYACHSTAPGVDLAGPSLAGIATKAAEMVASDSYTGSAQTAEGYVRESIVEPSADLVPGATYSAQGRSFMPDNFDETLSEQQVARLVAYLMTLR